MMVLVQYARRVPHSRTVLIADRSSKPPRLPHLRNHLTLSAMRTTFLAVFLSLAAVGCLSAQTTRPTSAPTTANTDKLPHIQIDIASKTVRVECLTVKADYALEFYCVAAGTNEYEAVLSSRVKPSHLHLALLMIGLQPGNSLHYDKVKETWVLPKGPALDINIEWTKDGKTVSYPAWRLMRELKTKKEVPPMTWVFAGSKCLPTGGYFADATGYLMSATNVEGMVIDLPMRVSNTMDDRLWEPNRDLLPQPGTKAWMVIRPAAGSATTKP